MTTRGTWTALLLVVTAAQAWPQPRFEVASIRPSAPGMTPMDARNNFHGNRFEAKAMTVGDILDMLGGYQLFRVVGGPNWMRTDRFDIVAKADRPLEAVDRQAAVMALLAERFHLQSHLETREVPGIVLHAPRGRRQELKPAGGATLFNPQRSWRHRVYSGSNVQFDELSVANVAGASRGRDGIEGSLRFQAGHIER